MSMNHARLRRCLINLFNMPMPFDVVYAFDPRHIDATMITDAMNAHARHAVFERCLFAAIRLFAHANRFS